MIRRSPRQWRLDHGWTQAFVAVHAKIDGRNPARTYDRYERGMSACPAEVIEAVRQLSDGEIGAESWHQARLDFLAGNPQNLPSDPQNQPQGVNS